MNDDDRVLLLRRWWESNGTLLIVALVLVIGGVVGWRWYNDYAQTRDEAASATYQRYLEARQRDASAEEIAALVATLDNDFRATGYRIFTLLYRAHDAAVSGNAAKATEYLEAAVKDSKDDSLRDISMLRLARMQAQSGGVDAALETLRKVKGAGFRSYVAELKGDILVRQNKPDEAREAYQAAAAAADPNEPQPVLEMKIVDLAKPNTPASNAPAP